MDGQEPIRVAPGLLMAHFEAFLRPLMKRCAIWGWCIDKPGTEFHVTYCVYTFNVIKGVNLPHPKPQVLATHDTGTQYDYPLQRHVATPFPTRIPRAEPARPVQGINKNEANF